jgi:serpin B
MAVEAVTDANANFGNALFKILAKPDQNFIMSSFSVNLVLNMILNGAKGRTASQLKEGLTLKDFDVVKKGFKETLTLLKTNEKITLNSANRIYYSIDNFLAKSYIQSTQELFLAEPIGMNFGRAEQSRTAINQWVEEKTNKKIQELIPLGSFDALTKLVLVNAIYFKGNWDVKFDKSKKQKGDFHVTPTQTVQTDMMFSTNKYGMLSDVKDLQGATALDMPYKGKRLSMIFLLPNHNDNSLADLEEAMSKVTDLNSILRFGRKTKVKVTLPRFKLESQFDLVQPLKLLGMTDMFD